MNAWSFLQLEGLGRSDVPDEELHYKLSSQTYNNIRDITLRATVLENGMRVILPYKNGQLWVPDPFYPDNQGAQTKEMNVSLDWSDTGFNRVPISEDPLITAKRMKFIEAGEGNLLLGTTYEYGWVSVATFKDLESDNPVDSVENINIEGGLMYDGENNLARYEFLCPGLTSFPFRGTIYYSGWNGVGFGYTSHHERGQIPEEFTLEACPIGSSSEARQLESEVLRSEQKRREVTEETLPRIEGAQDLPETITVPELESVISKLLRDVALGEPSDPFDYFREVR
ncbi:MAG: hypothetical protein QF824_01940 [Candidatus Woesearchaeota archaeon]|nr:hypothetical protein [Candidatus Woesearchaeota archaeon]